MKHFITLCFLLGTANAFADIVRSPIHSVVEVDGSYLIRFDNGRVAFSATDTHALKGDVVEAKVDGKQNLISIQTLAEGVGSQKSFSLVEPLEAPVYEPTVINGYAEAVTIFNRLNRNFKRSSECSNRAHVWSSEEYKNNGIKSHKAFLFLTSSYINRVRFKWWFHVAPAMIVQENGQLQTRVFDFVFNHKPVTLREWHDQFVFSKRDCLQLQNFSDYDLRADQTQDCYQKLGTMYDWMPADFAAQERGIYKTKFNQSEINAAYAEAF